MDPLLIRGCSHRVGILKAHEIWGVWSLSSVGYHPYGRETGVACAQKGKNIFVVCVHIISMSLILFLGVRWGWWTEGAHICQTVLKLSMQLRMTLNSNSGITGMQYYIQFKVLPGINLELHACQTNTLLTKLHPKSGAFFILNAQAQKCFIFQL